MLEEFVEWIRNYYQRPDGVIHLHETYIDDTDYNNIKECLDSGLVSTAGSYVHKLEDAVRKYTGAPHAVAMVNGTSALHLALKLVDVQPGDLVITTPFSFVATGNAILFTGARPLFVDIDLQTLGISPKELRRFLQRETIRLSDGYRYHKYSGARIAACVPVHSFGHPAQVDALVRLCSDYHIPLVEDAAAALGSFYKKKHLGTFGAAGIFSFNGNKIATAGGGGILVTQFEELAEKALHLSTQARVQENYGYWHDEMGYNYRMPALNAALASSQLARIQQTIIARTQLASAYASFFENTGYNFFKAPSGASSNYWMHTVLCKSKIERDAFVKFTNDNGIHTRPAWQLLPRFPMFQDAIAGNLENAAYIEDHLVCLPSSANLK